MVNIEGRKLRGALLVVDFLCAVALLIIRFSQDNSECDSTVTGLMFSPVLLGAVMIVFPTSSFRDPETTCLDLLNLVYGILVLVNLILAVACWVLRFDSSGTDCRDESSALDWANLASCIGMTAVFIFSMLRIIYVSNGEGC